jgi:hypothetical protein
MSPGNSPPEHPQVQALRKELEELQLEALRRDEEARQAERDANERRQQFLESQQTRAKELLACWIMRERFGLIVVAIGIAFAGLLAILPPVAGKGWLYGCALACVVAGAWQKDRANRHIARLLPELSSADLLAVRREP